MAWTKHVRWTIAGFFRHPILSIRNTIIVLAAFTWTVIVGITLDVILFAKLKDRLFGLSKGWDRVRRARFTWWAAHTFWVKVILFIGRIKIDNGGYVFDPSKRYVVVANHQSTLDIIMLVSMIPHGVIVAKKEVARYPFVGWAVKWGGMIMVDRKTPGETREEEEERQERNIATINTGLEELPDENWVTFPEGTRTLTGKMQDFKHGPFGIAVEQEIDILPMVIGPEAFESLPKGSLLELRPCTIRIRALPTINTRDFIREHQGSNPDDVVHQLMATTEGIMRGIFEVQRGEG